MSVLPQHGAAVAIAARHGASPSWRSGVWSVWVEDGRMGNKRTFASGYITRITLERTKGYQGRISSNIRRKIGTDASRSLKTPQTTSPRDGMLSRQNPHSRAMSTQRDQHYEAVVVGAGPAGITCLGNLLERKLSPILWVDDGFNGGRINRQYREVPSNTKVKLFVQFAEAVTPLREIVSGKMSRDRWDEASESDGVKSSGKGAGDQLQFMRELDQEKGCQLSYPADMCLMLTEGLRRTPGVEARQGRVTSAFLDSEQSSGARWRVSLNDDNDSTVRTKRLVLCTGASPDDPALPVHIPDIQNLPLDTALSPSRLRGALAAQGSEPVTVSVVGASHSAIIVLMNLYALASTSNPNLKVRWFTRHALRYAQEMDGWILRDNTGLKGEAAKWARENLEDETYDNSDAKKYIEKFTYPAGNEVATFEKFIPGSQYYVQAIGYSRDPIPELRMSNGKSVEKAQYDHEKGSFVGLPGLFGAGIAFPERVVDPHGNTEMAVGFWKFMRYVKRVSVAWD